MCFFFFFQAEDGIRDIGVTGVQTCALPIFTAGEQAFYAERGYSEPQRCSSCRASRKAQRASSGYDSGSSYSSGGGSSYSSGGGGYSRGGGGGGGYSSGPRQMYPAVCSS